MNDILAMRGITVCHPKILHCSVFKSRVVRRMKNENVPFACVNPVFGYPPTDGSHYVSFHTIYCVKTYGSSELLECFE